MLGWLHQTTKLGKCFTIKTLVITIIVIIIVNIIIIIYLASIRLNYE